MKNTYKLFGMIYDRLPETKIIYSLSQIKTPILDITFKKCLFDVNEYERKIDLSYLFSIESQEKLDILLNEISLLDKVILNVDVVIDNVIVQEFINKRVKQILCLLEKRCKNVYVTCKDNLNFTF